MFIFGRFSFPRPYKDTIFFCHRVTRFVTCVGIASMRLGEPSIHNHILKERRCRRGRPWASLRSLVRSATVSVSFLIASGVSTIAGTYYHFSTSKPPSEQTQWQWCSDVTLFGGAAVDTENCRPGAVGAGGGFPLSQGFLEDSAELSTCRGTWLPPKKSEINPLEMDLLLA